MIDYFFIIKFRPSPEYTFLKIQFFFEFYVFSFKFPDMKENVYEDVDVHATYVRCVLES